ncbi:MAG TPA: alpha-L-fucosidase [Phycisphaerae bacterium]|nr:alpha-L-fucosidase [Phycisphaerae bacterium]
MNGGKHVVAGLLAAAALASVGGVAAAQSGPRASAAIVDAAAAAKPDIAPGPVKPTWDSIRENYKVPQWFIDGKLGITMHWGLYSVAAYHNEWYEKYMYSTFAQWHAANFGPQDKFGYKDFIPKFTASKFNADELVALVKESGAKYFMPTAEHHDGFSLWDSDVNPWNAAKMGPKRDLIGEMATAARKAGLKFGICNHAIEHYTFLPQNTNPSWDLNDPKYQDFYWTEHNDERLQKFLEQWVSKSFELIDKYQPDIIWYDNGVNSRAFDPLKMKIAAHYYNRALQWHKEVTIDTKSTAYLAGSVLDFEKLHPRGPSTNSILKGVWEAEEPIGSTWGYSAANPVESFRSPQQIVSLFCEVLSLGGNLLLNLSPDGQGALSQPQVTGLKELGKWMAVNGQAVYGSHAWIQASDSGPGAGRNGKVTYRFTVKGNDLYAIAQAWPGETAVIPALAKGKAPEGTITEVSLLGADGKLEFTQDVEGLKVTLPAQGELKYAYVIKVSGLKMNPPGPAVPAVMADVQ